MKKTRRKREKINKRIQQAEESKPRKKKKIKI